MTVKPITGAPGYFVSDDGLVISEKRGSPRILAHYPDKDGYLRVVLMVDGRRVNRTVASLVAQEFIGPRPEGQEVRHWNGVRTDNRLGNLSYGTSRENKEDARRHGTLPVGEQNGRARLTREQVMDMRVRVAGGEPQSTFVKLYGVSSATISYAVRCETWCD